MTANTTTTTSTTRKIPNPLYAAAGAGDLAYQQLRRLPEQVAQLRAQFEELRPAVSGAVSEDNLRTLRGVARRNAATLRAGAQVAQDRAVAVYTGLVARGEKVISTARGAEAKVEFTPVEKAVTAEITATQTPAATVAPVEGSEKKMAAKKVAPKADGTNK